MKPFVRTAGEGESSWFLTNHMTLKATKDETAGGRAGRLRESPVARSERQVAREDPAEQRRVSMRPVRAKDAVRCEAPVHGRDERRGASEVPRG